MAAPTLSMDLPSALTDALANSQQPVIVNLSSGQSVAVMAAEQLADLQENALLAQHQQMIQAALAPGGRQPLAGARERIRAAVLARRTGRASANQ